MSEDRTLVERLKSWESWTCIRGTSGSALLLEVAAELTRLTKEVESLEATIEELSGYCPTCGSCGIVECCGIKCHYVKDQQRSYNELIKEVAVLESKIPLSLNNVLVTAVIAHKNWFETEWKKADKEDSAGGWNSLRHENERRLTDLGRRVIQEIPTDIPSFQEVVEELDAYLLQAMENPNMNWFEARFCVKTQATMGNYFATLKEIKRGE